MGGTRSRSLVWVLAFLLLAASCGRDSNENASEFTLSVGDPPADVMQVRYDIRCDNGFSDDGRLEDFVCETM